MSKKLSVEYLSKKGLSKDFFEDCLAKGMTIKEIALLLNINSETVTKYLKFYEMKPLGASYFNKGCNNPAKRKEVRDKISTSVKGLWDNDIYKDRINGMMYKTDWESPNFKPHNHYRDYLKSYQKLECYYCGASEQERKIDVHHLDENRENWLLTNLLPVCNVCHQFFHFKRYKGLFCTVSKEFTFENAHHLMNYEGPCENKHGHSYFLQVFVKGRINRDTGMVIDYKNLKKVVNDHIINNFDHAYSNDFMDCNPTAENMLFYIWEKLEKEGLVKGLNKILLKETANSEAFITWEDMLEYYTINKEIIVLENPNPKVLKSGCNGDCINCFENPDCI